MNWPFRKRNPARELALVGVRKREWQRMNENQRIKAVARVMREQCNLPPDPRLA